MAQMVQVMQRNESLSAENKQTLQQIKTLSQDLQVPFRPRRANEATRTAEERAGAAQEQAKQRAEAAARESEEAQTEARQQLEAAAEKAAKLEEETSAQRARAAVLRWMALEGALADREELMGLQEQWHDAQQEAEDARKAADALVSELERAKEQVKELADEVGRVEGEAEAARAEVEALEGSSREAKERECVLAEQVQAAQA
eukprot:2444387-Rhodomonas_salina.3